MHWNDPTFLPPVGIWFLILLNGSETKVKRESYISERNNDLIYRKEDGSEISGKYKWSYI